MEQGPGGARQEELLENSLEQEQEVLVNPDKRGPAWRLVSFEQTLSTPSGSLSQLGSPFGKRPTSC